MAQVSHSSARAQINYIFRQLQPDQLTPNSKHIYVIQMQNKRTNKEKSNKCASLQKVAGYTLQLFAGYTTIMEYMNEESIIEKLIAKALGNTLKARRNYLKLSQEVVAISASIDRSHYQIIEAGLGNRKTLSPANPRLHTLLRLADSLDCSLVELLQDTSDLFEEYRKSRAKAKKAK